MYDAPRLLTLLLAAILLAGCTSSASTPADTWDQSAFEDGITVGAVTFILTDLTVQDRIGDTTSTNGTFLVLRLGMRNTGTDATTIGADQFAVTAGERYGIVSRIGTVGGEPVLARQQLDPGFAGRTTLVFDVPQQESYTLTIRQDSEQAAISLAP